VLTWADDHWTATTADDARAVLSDDRLIVASVPDDGPPGGVRRLRAAVCRFAEGAQHAERRARVVAELAGVEPATLAATARAHAERLRDDAGPDFLRRAATAALAERLGAVDPIAAADAVLAVAPAYFPGADDGAEAAADEALPRLRAALAAPDDDTETAWITLLLQGCDATGALVETALAAGLSIEDALRRRPPLPALRRVAAADVVVAGTAIRAGERVVVDVAAASDPEVVTFGLGRRPCPARAHAEATASVLLEVALDAPPQLLPR